MEFAIQTDNLTKIYGDKVGCDRICLSVQEGQIFGFLGPNGAGKSTLVKMLVGLLKPTSGTAQLLGRPLGSLEARKRIGFLPENFRYHYWLNSRKVLEFHASLYKMDRQSKAARIPLVQDMLGIAAAGRQKVRTFSKGMQQRLGIAVALLADPDLVFLDEPTSALDPLGRREVREILLRLRERGKTVFLNSHLLSEVELICDQVAFIKKGRIVAVGRPEDMQAKSLVLEIVVDNINEDLLAEVKKVSRLVGLDRQTIRVAVKSKEDIPCLAEAVMRGGSRLYKLSPEKISLEEVFVSLLQDEHGCCSPAVTGRRGRGDDNC